jgi:peptidoglycan hydrolase-like protein with peptidoglycan-binding domain
VRQRFGVRVGSIIGSVIVATVLAGGQSSATVTFRPARHAVASSVALSASAPAVAPNAEETFTATLSPIERNRTVVLRLWTGSRFRNLASATSNHDGVATFTRSFSAVGEFLVRAEVLATADEPRIVGHRISVLVATVLPFVLPSTGVLRPGDQGAAVLDLQERLSKLGYWLGTPGGYFGDATEQAVFALEKAAGIARTGVVSQAFVDALNAGVVPTPRTTSGSAIDVDLTRDLVEFVRGGKLVATLNTSTGGGYTYTQDGTTNVATTPRGIFHTDRVVNGTVIDTLGTLWRPRFFDEGFAIHGDSYVPAVPTSHGCVRVSDEAIDWIWSANLDPIGMTVWVYAA